MQKDSLGDRIKGHYENRTRYLLPRRTYTVVRVDGKAFHTYTRDCRRPFDSLLMEDMDSTAVALCKEIEGAALAYIQSDEISLLLTDFGNTQTEGWFVGNIQKIASLSASIATAHFNSFRRARILSNTELPDTMALARVPIAYFDSRVFTIPDPIEVENYFIWRQQDATRNSVSMTAHTYFDHERLQGVTSHQMQEMLWQEKGINWNDTMEGFKRGRCVVKRTAAEDREYIDKRTGEAKVAEGVLRTEWQPTVPPVFTQERSWLQSHIPRLNS